MIVRKYFSTQVNQYIPEDCYCFGILKSSWTKYKKYCKCLLCLLLMHYLSAEIIFIYFIFLRECKNQALNTWICKSLTNLAVWFKWNLINVRFALKFRAPSEHILPRESRFEFQLMLLYKVRLFLHLHYCLIVCFPLVCWRSLQYSTAHYNR